MCALDFISTSLQLALPFSLPRSPSIKSTFLSALLPLVSSSISLLMFLVEFYCRNTFKICARKVSTEGVGVITSIQINSDSDCIWLSGTYP